MDFQRLAPISILVVYALGIALGIHIGKVRRPKRDRKGRFTK